MSCLVCQINPDVKCTACKKKFCGDCWKYDSKRRTRDKCNHNAPYQSLGCWAWTSHKPYNEKYKEEYKKELKEKECGCSLCK